MKKIELEKWGSAPACLYDFKNIEKTINDMIDEIEELKIQLSRIKKNRPNPRDRNPYKINKKSNYK
jgi:hypothetical protein